ncbi:hypothetical protein [Leucobacter japonicus]|uniref:hypothetical protein n=1 Tax=Leucobacter japonicus TaxID=1461259 RepID=UPI0006A7B76D|nr:hypothetical protein [Leucobacter japonicus]
MTNLELRPDRRAFGWGLAATIVSAAGILPIAIVILLMVTVDQNYGWLLLIVMPLSALIGAVGAVLGIVALCFAISARRTYAWPITGIVLGAVQVIAIIGLLTGAWS